METSAKVSLASLAAAAVKEAAALTADGESMPQPPCCYKETFTPIGWGILSPYKIFH